VAETIQLSEALGYPFRDSRWPGKAGILALLSFIPVLNFAAIGFEVETARRVAQHETLPMPDWGELREHFMRGLWLALARYIYALPLMLLAVLASIAGFAFVFTIDTQYDAWTPLLGLACGGAFFMMMLFGFLFSFFSPAITVRYLEVGTFASCFHVAAIWKNFRRHTTAHLAVFGSILAFGLAISLIAGPAVVFLSFIPCIGTIAYMLVLAAMVSAVLLFTAHLEGQLLRIVRSSPPVPAQ
jgi:hypothetical protein